MTKVHRMVEGKGVADTGTERRACGVKADATWAVRFPVYLRAFIDRNPDFVPCRRCWPEE